MDAEGSAMRAKMQSAALLSDMESFKAANPGCTLGDFVRWHSPRDWEEKGNGKVRLYNHYQSGWQRMGIGSNPIIRFTK